MKLYRNGTTKIWNSYQFVLNICFVKIYYYWNVQILEVRKIFLLYHRDNNIIFFGNVKYNRGYGDLFYGNKDTYNKQILPDSNRECSITFIFSIFVWFCWLFEHCSPIYIYLTIIYKEEEIYYFFFLQNF